MTAPAPIVGPFRLDPESHEWDIIDSTGQLVAGCFGEDCARLVLVSLNERHLRDTASKFADAAREATPAAPGGGILPDKWRAY